MRLTELDPVYLLAGNDPPDVQGVEFDCPKCRAHKIIVLFAGVPPEIEPGPGRWLPKGDGFENLTLVGANGGSDSISVDGDCASHFEIALGEVIVV